MLLTVFKISGHSMEPTIKNGESVLSSSIPYLFSKPKVGDIVVIRHSGLSRISIHHEESGEILESQASPDPQNDGGDVYLVKRIVKINSGRYFIRGDNEKDSLDSRRFGWIERKDIVGKVVHVAHLQC